MTAPGPMTSFASPSFLPRGATPSTTYAPTTEPRPSSTFGPTIAVLWTSRPTLVTPTSKPDALLQRDARAVRLQRPVRRLEHAHDSNAGIAVAPRHGTVAHALDEVAHLELQRLCHRDVRAVDVA